MSGRPAHRRRRRQQRPSGARSSVAAAAVAGMGDGKSFAAVDFETATPRRDSACAVGVVVFEDGVVASRQHWLIQPPDNAYAERNTAIHGISAGDTVDAAGFPDVWAQAEGLLRGRLVVMHNSSFDMSVLRDSAERHGVRPEALTVVCTLKVARAMLPRAPSHRLDELAAGYGIAHVHHDAQSDAEAAGGLWLALLERHGRDAASLLRRFGQRY